MAKGLKYNVSVDTSQAEQGLDKITTKTEQASSSTSNFSNKQQTLTGALRSATRELQQLEIQYQQLSAADKNTDFGSNLKQRIDELYQKAGTLADIKADIQQNIQNIASDTASWDAMKQAIDVTASSITAFASAMGIAKEDGSLLAQTVNTIARVQAIANAAISIGNAIQKQSALMVGVKAIQQKALAAAQSADTIATTANTAATTANTTAVGANAVAEGTMATATEAAAVATGKATIAQAAFNAIANANPYVLLASALLAVGTAIVGYCSYMGNAAKAQEEANKKAEQAIKKQEELRRKEEELGATTGDVTGKFYTLQAQWQQLKSVGERKQWIDDNQSSFNSLGISIYDVKTAEDVFVNNTSAVVDALIARAVAAKKAEQAAEDLINLEKKRAQKSTASGDYYIKANDDNITAEERKKLNIAEYETVSNGNGGYYTRKHKMDAAERAKVDKMRSAEAANRKRQLKKEYDEEEKTIKDGITKSVKAQGEAESQLAKLGNKPKKTDNSPKTSSTETLKPETDSLAYIDNLITEIENKIKNTNWSGNTKGLDEAKAKLEELKKKRDELQQEINPKYNGGSLTEIENKISEIQNKLKNTDWSGDTEGLGKTKNELRELIILKNQLQDDISVNVEFIGIDKVKNNLTAAFEDAKKAQDKLLSKTISAKDVYKTTNNNFGLDNKDSAQLDTNNALIEVNNTGIDEATREIETLTAAYEKLQNAIATANGRGLDTSEQQAELDNLGARIDDLNAKRSTMQEQNSGLIDSNKTLADSLAKQSKNIKALTAATGAVNSLGQAFSSLGDAFDNDALNIAGIIAQAIANVILGFANGLPQEGAKGGVWGYIAASVAGLATVAATVAQINSLSKHAGGGIVPGSSHIGDMNLIRANAGEMVLNNVQQARLFRALNTGNGLGDNDTSQSNEVTFEISGRNLVGTLYNNNRKRRRLI